MPGKLYEEKPHLRESAFTYFYMGINIGGSVGPLLCGFVGEKLGWHYGFGLAGFGMFTGLLQLYFGKKFLGEVGKSPNYRVFQTQTEQAKLSLNDKKKILFIILLSLTSVFFWVPYEQMGSSVNLYTDRKVDRILFGFEVPASVFQSVNGFLILVFAPFMAWFWNWLSHRSKDFSLVAKIIFSFLLLGVSYFFLYLGELLAMEKASLIFLMLYYVFLTIGELCISPIGLSTVAKIAPVQIGSLLMGVWFLSNAVSHYVSGWLAGEYAKWFSMLEFFLFLFGICLFASMILLIFKNKMNRLIIEEN
ncbi:MAG: peptide MFS transporter [Leptospiraceae bacterium]|nr:peptide MFS transporter [Leptospiraceae bacterium]